MCELYPGGEQPAKQPFDERPIEGDTKGPFFVAAGRTKAGRRVRNKIIDPHRGPLQ